MQHPPNINTLTAGAVSFGDNSSATGIFNAYHTAQPQGGQHIEGVSRTLLVVVADVERDALLHQVGAATGAAPTRRRLPTHTVFELGRISSTEVLLAQVGQGTITPDAGAVAAGELIAQLRPDHLILTGICYGLKNDDRSRPQQLGDVVVASQLRLIGHHRVTQADTDDEITYRSRGGEVHPSPKLLDRFRSAGMDWRSTAAVHIGPVLTESVLVDSRDYRQRLKLNHPEAVAGEMEGSGIYAAAARDKVDWAVVKAICDWGHGKGDGHQHQAADNIASFLVHTMRIGALDPVSDVSSS